MPRPPRWPPRTYAHRSHAVRSFAMSLVAGWVADLLTGDVTLVPGLALLRVLVWVCIHVQVVRGRRGVLRLVRLRDRQVAYPRPAAVAIARRAGQIRRPLCDHVAVQLCLGDGREDPAEPDEPRRAERREVVEPSSSSARTARGSEA